MQGSCSPISLSYPFLACSFRSAREFRSYHRINVSCNDIPPDHPIIFVPRVDHSDSVYSLLPVYETYQPIPGYGNLLIFYLTQALAWELPSQAYHPEEHLQDLWDDVVFPNDQYDEVLVNNQQVADAAANNLQNSIQEKNGTDHNSNAYSPNPMKGQNGQYAPPQNQQQGQPLQRNGEQPYNGNGNYYSNTAGVSAPNRYYSNYQSPQKVSGLMEPIRKTISNKMDYYLSYADKLINQVTNFASEKHDPWKNTQWTTYSQRLVSYG